MAIPMTSLNRAPNGDWFARKGIPKDVRADYKVAFGVSREERFRRPAYMSVGQAKQDLREWDSTITSRIEALRAKGRGEGQSLTQMQAHALSGDWYNWFVGQYSEEPGKPIGWDMTAAIVRDIYYSGPAPDSPDDPKHPDHPDYKPPPNIARRVQQRLSEGAQVQRFLADKNIVLTDEASAQFLDALEPEFYAACQTLERRSTGDYSPDDRPNKFPIYEPRRATGLTVWNLFEQWVGERKPSDATVNRWRAALRNLHDRCSDVDVNEITEEEAQQWARQLITEERSAQTVKEVWLRAAHTVFGWAKEHRLIDVNPFMGVKITVPRKVTKRHKWFYPEEIRTVLNATLDQPPSNIAAHYRAARRWVPWLQAYTGARAGEITQLRGSDVTLEEGIRVIRLTPEAGTIKTKEARTVPLHEHLLEQGFVEFAEEAGDGPLFYNPIVRRKKPSHDPTNPIRSAAVKTRTKLAGWVRSIGVDNPDLSPTHAWRHTFKRIADRQGISDRVSNAITGHAQESEANKYGLPSLEDMSEALKRFPRYELEDELVC